MRKTYITRNLVIFFFILINLAIITAQTTYTATSDTNCNNGVCTKTLYSGVRNVYEDNQWKKIESARSLKDKGFEINYLEIDDNFPLEVVDFNYSSITVRLNPKGIKVFNQNIPVRIWDRNDTKSMEFDEAVSKGEKISNGVVDYKEKMNKVFEEDRNFWLLNQEDVVTYNFGLSKVLEFGFNSTTVILQDADSEVLEDTYTQNGNDTSRGSEQTIRLGRDNYEYMIFIKFNLSSINTDVTLINASLRIFPYDVSSTNAGTVWGFIYGLKNNSWNEDQFGSTDNPLTPANNTNNVYLSQLLDKNVGNTAGSTFNVTLFVNDSIGNSSVSFFINGSAFSSLAYWKAYSKEYPSALGPELTVTYEPPPDTTHPYFTTIPGSESSAYGTQWSGVEFIGTDETALNSYFINDTDQFSINSTGWLNYSKPLGVGTYKVNVSINDTSNNINYTIYTLTIIQGNLTGTLSNNRTDTFNYDGAKANISISESNGGDADVTYNLYKDGTDVGVSNAEASAGTYEYKLNSTGGVNWTSNASIDTKTLTINKATPSFSTSVTTSIEYGNTSDYSGSESNFGDDDVSYSLKRDDIEIDTGSSVDDTTILSAGTYEYNYSGSGGDNWTTGYDPLTLTVTKKKSYPLMVITGTTSIEYGLTSDFSEGETNTGDADCSYSMDLSNKVYGVGTWTFNYSTSGNINYSTGSTILEITINKANLTGTLNNATNKTLTYGNPFNFTIIETNTGDADVTYSVFRNDADVTNQVNTNVILGVGYYNFTLNTTGGTNYTSNASLSNFTVIINKATPTASLTSDLGWSINESQEVTIGLSETNTGDADVTYIVYRNNVSKGTEETWSVTTGTYIYILNTTGGVNYSLSSSLDSEILTVTASTNTNSDILNICSSSGSSLITAVGIAGILFIIVLVGFIITILMLSFKGIIDIGDIVSDLTYDKIIGTVMSVLLTFLALATLAYLFLEKYCTALGG